MKKFILKVGIYFYVVGFIVAVVLVLGYVFESTEASDGSNMYRESARCGPHHHWHEIRTGMDLESTCEMDDRYKNSIPVK